MARCRYHRDEHSLVRELSDQAHLVSWLRLCRNVPWGLIAVPAVSILLSCEFLIILIALRRHTDRAQMRIHEFAAIIAILAEGVFLFVRSYA